MPVMTMVLTTVTTTRTTLVTIMVRTKATITQNTTTTAQWCTI